MRVYVELKGAPDGRLPACPDTCRASHPLRLWVIHRKAKPWGHFAVASINGEERVLDSSLPTKVDRVPKGAVELQGPEVARLWHEDNESHVFGGPNIAKQLRASIKAHNERVRA